MVLTSVLDEILDVDILVTRILEAVRFCKVVFWRKLVPWMWMSFWMDTPP